MKLQTDHHAALQSLPGPGLENSTITNLITKNWPFLGPTCDDSWEFMERTLSQQGPSDIIINSATCEKNDSAKLKLDQKAKKKYAEG